MGTRVTWRQERPSWCPHKDCLFKRRALDSLCGGELPEPTPHDGDMNTHRICINADPIFDLQVNRADIGWFKWIFEAMAPVVVKEDEKYYPSLKKSWNRDVASAAIIGALIIMVCIYVIAPSIIATGLSLISLCFWGMSIGSLLARRKLLDELKKLEADA